MARACKFKVGDRVKPSAYALEGKRQRAAEYRRTETLTPAQRWYDEAKALRGTVTGILPAGTGFNVALIPGVKVTWDDGTVSESLDDMVELSTDEVRR